MELNIAAACEAIAAAHPELRRWSPRTAPGPGPRSRNAPGAWRRCSPRQGSDTTALRRRDRRWSSPHDHVALYLHNGPEYLEGMLGAWKARCAPFNVNYRYVAEELRYLLDDACTRAIVFHDRFAPVLAEVLPTLRRPPELLLQVRDGSDRRAAARCARLRVRAGRGVAGAARRADGVVER